MPIEWTPSDNGNSYLTIAKETVVKLNRSNEECKKTPSDSAHDRDRSVYVKMLIVTLCAAPFCELVEQYFISYNMFSLLTKKTNKTHILAGFPAAPCCYFFFLKSLNPHSQIEKTMLSQYHPIRVYRKLENLLETTTYKTTDSKHLFVREVVSRITFATLSTIGYLLVFMYVAASVPVIALSILLAGKITWINSSSFHAIEKFNVLTKSLHTIAFFIKPKILGTLKNHNLPSLKISQSTTCSYQNELPDENDKV